MSEARKAVKWDRSKGRPEPIRALNKILEKENKEPLMSILEVAPKVVIMRAQVIPFVRAKVAQMLKIASESLPEGYQLGVFDAWRPFARQQRIYDFMWQCAKVAFPDRNDVALRRTVCRWVAPTDQKAPPGHCTGAAVDVWLLDANGEELDLTSPYDRFGAAPTYIYGLTVEAQKNRNMLLEAMLDAGFSNCRDEWWHYSWGDAGWAVRSDQKECPYGISHLDPTIYEAQEKISEEFFKDRPNPFLSPE
jgi:zinc D-Ala-D-Ala dipeptidase